MGNAGGGFGFTIDVGACLGAGLVGCEFAELEALCGGVLEGAGGSTDVIKDIIEKSARGPGNIVYDADPKKLVEKVLELVKKEKIIKV